MEATEDVVDTLRYIRKCNVEAGLAFCPETSAEMIPKYLDQCDLILLMTVHPGFGGQAFIPDVLEKIRFTRAAIEMRNIRKGGECSKADADSVPPFNIQVDGGIDDKWGKKCVEAGANVLVSGTHLFGSPQIEKRIAALKGLSE